MTALPTLPFRSGHRPKYAESRTKLPSLEPQNILKSRQCLAEVLGGSRCPKTGKLSIPAPHGIHIYGVLRPNGDGSEDELLLSLDRRASRKGGMSIPDIGSEVFVHLRVEHIV